MAISIYWLMFKCLKDILNINSKNTIHIYLCLFILINFGLSSDLSCQNKSCLHGKCHEGRCFCDHGWQGVTCNHCEGRIRLTTSQGFISDGVGNYSVDLHCSWLINTGRPNIPIRFQLIQFETECSWDHVYIFDGDSIFAPLIAAFSGVLVKAGSTSTREIVARSGAAYLYFYSDAAYNMSGFNISYRLVPGFNISYSILSCSQDCNGRGICQGGECICTPEWTGEGCQNPICPHGCVEGECDIIEKRCICLSEYTGDDCSIPKTEGWWGEVDTIGRIEGRALHASVVIDDGLYVFGGDNFRQLPFQEFALYNFTTSQWSTVTLNASLRPLSRHGHSLVTYKRKVYMFGGMLNNGTLVRELWLYDPLLHAWAVLAAEPECGGTEPCTPLATIGHSSTVVGNHMVVIFGYNPIYGYLNAVQQYDFVTDKWQLIQTKGAIVKGGYGHSSAFDPTTQDIYIYGGYHSFGSEAALVNYLYRYNPWKQSWMLLRPSPSHRYLHTSVIQDGLLIIFGGNTHNGTTYSQGDKCFSPDTLIYDIACDTWHFVTFPNVASQDIARFGHSSVTYKNNIFVFGGFNGQILNSLISFTPGSCQKFTNHMECEKALPGVKCLWSYEKRICFPLSSVGKTIPYIACSRKGLANGTTLCKQLTTCLSCVENTYGCVWCGSWCAYGKCSGSGKTGIRTTQQAERCEEAESSNCDKLHTCQACHTEYHCGWQVDDKCYTFVRETGTKMEKAVLSDDYRVRCEPACADRHSCEECTAGPCMWCASSRTCIELNAYAAMFPLAQCLEWTTQLWKCSKIQCRDLQTCHTCQKNARCGWCDNGSGTGLGRCMDGAHSGPMTDQCENQRWYFISCPKCQCNGHSTCLNGTEICEQPCKHLTEGLHCEQCQGGWYGSPVNGGNCTRCFCNHHGSMCHPDTGVCYCNTKGVTGPHCERCDEPNHYLGNPKEPGGTCFYNLSIDFQYTFNMSKSEDRYYTQINFMNTPLRADLDVDFSITCSDIALVNISIASLTKPERLLHERKKCGSFKLRFPHGDNTFGVKNTTFFVYVYNFTSPFVVQISFSQHRTLDLLQFFVTFSSCFLSLLITAAVLWKIKLKYDVYRRRQRLFVEMEQLALRPCATALVDLSERKASEPECPTPIALEPCVGGKAAILSLLVKLPNCGNEYTPFGYSGIAIASAIVSLGVTNKPPDPNKELVQGTWKVRLT